MTEDAETTHPSEHDASADDKRFEVKWRKKEQSRPRPESAETEVAADGQAAVAADRSAEVAELQRQLEEERQRVTDLRDRWQRAAADLANLRRRTEQERGEMEKFASMLLVQELLPVLDNFNRALATIPGNLQMLTWIHGMMLIERQLQAILERRGLAPIEAQGQAFNAYFHEAIAERETDEAPVGSIIQEYQKGYTMHGTVLRPALVEVAAARTVSSAEDSVPPEESGEPAETAPETTDKPAGQDIAEEAETENIGP